MNCSAQNLQISLSGNKKKEEANSGWFKGEKAIMKHSNEKV